MKTKLTKGKVSAIIDDKANSIELRVNMFTLHTFRWDPNTDFSEEPEFSANQRKLTLFVALHTILGLTNKEYEDALTAMLNASGDLELDFLEE